MNLLLLAKRYNLLVRKSDGLYNSDKTDPLFKAPKHINAFKSLCLGYQNIIENHKPLSLEAICELSKKIVNAQHFVDGNHRTALLLCFHLCIYYNDTLPRINPYLLYAAIDFEYLKNIYNLNEEYGHFFASNAINTAINSRAQTKISAPALKKTHMEEITAQVLSLASLLEKLKAQVRKDIFTANETTQIKLFGQYAGFRTKMSHSTEIESKANYLFSLKTLKNKDGVKLLDDYFDPTLDLYKADKRHPKDIIAQKDLSGKQSEKALLHHVSFWKVGGLEAKAVPLKEASSDAATNFSEQTSTTLS